MSNNRTSTLDLVDAAAVAVPASRERDVTVAVVINTFNQTHYLDESIRSVLAQTRLPDQIVVVDDGSADDPATVVRNYSGVDYVHQLNQGLSASRNTGLAATSATFIVFLDADDRLAPEAIALGLHQHETHPGCGLVYGGYKDITKDGHDIGPAIYRAVGPNPFENFLRANIIGMHAAVMYDRAALVRHGGFDTSLRRCEDYDVYLKFARNERLSSYPQVAAYYRRHDANMSLDHAGMLAAALRVLDAQKQQVRPGSGELLALAEGRTRWRERFARAAFGLAFARDRSAPAVVRYPRAALAAMRVAPMDAIRVMSVFFFRGVIVHVSSSVVQLLKKARRFVTAARLDWGPFSRTRPLSANFGFDRGKPIDRYYVERFLEQCAEDIKGRTLEIGDASYTRQFGGARVTQADVLHVHAGNPQATIIGDLSDPTTLPEGAFDCLVLTQTLHLIYDLKVATAAIHRALKPGGVALLTVPGISQIDRGEWGSTWYWALTPAAATRLFGDAFGSENVTVQSHGNVYAATRFLQGMALEEADRGKLDVWDEAYPVIVTIRAVKRN